MWQMYITWSSISGTTMMMRLCRILLKMRLLAVLDSAMAMSSATCTGAVEWKTACPVFYKYIAHLLTRGLWMFGNGVLRKLVTL